MRASWLAGIALAAGCSGSGGVGKVVDNAVLAAVSPDERFIAYYTNYQLMSDNAAIGSLTVQPFANGAATSLGDGAFGAAYDRDGSALFWGTTPTASTDTDAAPNTTYGALNVWTPQMSAGVKITNGLATYNVTPPDGSFALAFDGPSPTRTQTGDVVLVRTAECQAAACKPITLASGVVVSQMSASEDSRFAAYVVVNGTGARAMHEAWLVDVTKGTSTMLASSATFNFASLSPDGNLVAVGADVQTAGIPVPLPLQLEVFSTTTGMKVAWAAQPMNTGTTQAAFADAQTLITRVTNPTNPVQGMGSIYSSTASAATQIVKAAKIFILQRNTQAAARWLFVSVNTTTNQPPYDLQLYDLMNPSAAVVQLATSGAAPLVSDDGTLVRFSENYDAATQAGSLELTTLATGAATKIADGVNVAVAQFGDQGDTLYYLDALGGTGTLSSVVAGAAAPTPVAKNVFNFRSRAMPSPTLYFAITAADPLTGASTPGIFQTALHQ